MLLEQLKKDQVQGLVEKLALAAKVIEKHSALVVLVEVYQEKPSANMLRDNFQKLFAGREITLKRQPGEQFFHASCEIDGVLFRSMYFRHAENSRLLEMTETINS